MCRGRGEPVRREMNRLVRLAREKFVRARIELAIPQSPAAVEPPARAWPHQLLRYPRRRLRRLNGPRPAAPSLLSWRVARAPTSP
jgi:hypothetical protein